MTKKYFIALADAIREFGITVGSMMKTQTENKAVTGGGNASRVFDDKRRHELVNLPYNGERYDIRHYDGLTYDNLQTLIKEGFADVNDTQNDSPTIGEIALFLKRNPDFTAHGYIVNPNRSDVRVSIEGVESPRNRDTDDFVEMFRHADEFSLNPPRAWYD